MNSNNSNKSESGTRMIHQTLQIPQEHTQIIKETRDGKIHYINGPDIRMANPCSVLII